MSSLVTDLDSSTAQEIVNHAGHDCRRVAFTCRRDSTRQLSRVGGVYWALLDSDTVVGRDPSSAGLESWRLVSRRNLA